MALATQTSRKALRDIKPERESVPNWAHPEVLYWYDEWRLIRDAASGERDVKDGSGVYLPRLDGMDNEAEYQAYVDRATYYNFTGRTIQALVGTQFKKDPKVSGLPARLEALLPRIAQTGSDFTTFAVNTATEVFTLGRYGVLVDLPSVASDTPQPYITGYTAENIVDWEWENDSTTGRQKLVRVVLREFTLGRSPGDKTQRYFASYRVLLLVNGVYTQHYFKAVDGDADVFSETFSTVTPQVRGTTLSFIPFMFFGVTKNEPEIEKSPMLDIARINISHFKSYAHLEHGRFYTGLPIYYREGDGTDDQEEYVLGPSTVWNLPPNAKAGVIEFNGQGLKFLENALSQKENHAASLGGRMVGITAQSTAETDNQTELKNRNEQALLLNMSRILDNGFTIILRWWAMMSAATDAALQNVKVEFTKDFLLTGAGSREFRAIHSMYKDGVIPIEVVYDYLQKNEVIPDWLELVEFKTLLDSQDSFPNNPDFTARKQGYPNAQSQVTDEQQTAALEAEADNLDTQITADEKAAKITAKTAEKTAAAQAKVAAQQPKPKPVGAK
jgi:Domain of unknown function (DUF4055)